MFYYSASSLYENGSEHLAPYEIKGLVFSGGTGEPNEPFRIAIAEQLASIAEFPDLLDKHLVLANDINLDPNLFGGRVFDKAVIPTFSGTFDGNDHTLSHLTIKGKGTWFGLFGKLESGAEVKDLAIVDVNITDSGYFIGGLVGRNNGHLTSCYITGTVSGDECVGGLVGYNYFGGITLSYSTGTVSGNEEVGGLIGGGYAIDVQNCVWDVETSGLLGSAGGLGLTTAEKMDPYMLGLNGFANDPNWILDAGRDYPRLAWEGTPGQIIPEPVIDWLDGQGTEEEPYRVDTADQLIILSRASGLWDKHFILGADINLDPNLQGRQVFSQAVIPVFSGVFDGNGHVIDHIIR